MKTLRKQIIKRQASLFFCAGVILFSMLLIGENVLAQQEGAPVELVKMITLDDRGKQLRFPASVLFDKKSQEIYLINGGRGRIVIYGPGPGYVPLISVGPGRHIDAPTGISLDKSGRLYICQSETADKPNRVTIFNGALLIENEITFEGIAFEEKVVPQSAVAGKDGRIYLSSQLLKGILIFDSKGNFLRRLIPMIHMETGEVVATLAKMPGVNEPPAASEEEQPQQHVEQDDSSPDLSSLPPELRPKIKRRIETGPRVAKNKPVSVRQVVTDEKGRLYLLSEEDSRIYVYSPEEKFLYAFGQKGGGPKKMSRPRSLALDENKQWAYVVDYMRHTILVYDLVQQGKYLFEFGGRGVGPGWFNYPASAAVSSEGYVIVGDYFNQRVQILDVLVEYKPVGPTIKNEESE